MIFWGNFFKGRCNQPDYNQLIREIGQLKGAIMATKEEVLQAIADEKAQVSNAVNDLSKQIQDLKDQIANGSPVTPADLDEIATAVHNIFVPSV